MKANDFISARIQRSVNMYRQIDWLSIIIYLMLMGIGLINIYAAVYNPESPELFDISQRHGKQLMWTGASILLAIVIMSIDSSFYTYFSYPFYILMLIILLSVAFLGVEVHNSRSWFDIGSFRLQPSELAKFATALALAKFLSTYNLDLRRFRHLFIALVIVFTPTFFIMLQPDVGSAVVYASLVIALFREGMSPNLILIGLVFFLIFFLALIIPLHQIFIGLLIGGALYYMAYKRSFRQGLVAVLVFGFITLLVYLGTLITNRDMGPAILLVVSLLVSMPVFFVLSYRFKLVISYYLLPLIFVAMVAGFGVDYGFQNVLKPHHQERILSTVGLLPDSYNLEQSKIAIGSGGLTGKGFLQGTQTKGRFVPEQSTDFIFSTVGEEWGFAGTTTLIVLYVVLLLRLLFLAERQRSTYSRVYGFCVVGILFFHMLINIGMTIGLAPVIGIPLPFISYGGSSEIGFTILLFIFLRLDVDRNALLK